MPTDEVKRFMAYFVAKGVFNFGNEDNVKKKIRNHAEDNVKKL